MFIQKILTYKLNSLIFIIVLAYYYDSVAQLGEHHLDRVGVAGSSPVRIINQTLVPQRF